MLRAVAGTVAGSPGSFSTLTVAGQATFSGQILAGDGSVSAPSYSFGSNPGTGIFSTSGRVMVASNSSSVAGFTNLGLSILGGTYLAFSTGNDPVSNDVFLSRDAPGLYGVRESIGVRGGAGFGAKAIAGSYSVTQDDFTICCSTATQGFTVLLPLSPAMNQLLNIKKVSADANRLTIDGNGKLIDALGFQSTIAQTRPNFQLQFGSSVSGATGSAWSIL